MQKADVEQPGDRRRIGERDILGHFALRETLAVNGGADVLDDHGVRPVRAQDRDIVGEFEASGERIGGVVIAEDHDDAHAMLAEAPHLAREEKPGVIALPLAVEDVAGDDDEAAFLRDGERDEIVEGLARGVVDASRKILGFPREPKQRAVEMKIGGVDETKAQSGSFQGRSASPKLWPGRAIYWSDL